MTRTRRILFQLLLLALICSLVKTTWDNERKSLLDTPSKLDGKNFILSPESMEEKLLTIRSKILVGAIMSIDRQSQVQPQLGNFASEIRQSLTQTINQTLETEREQLLKQEAGKAPAQLSAAQRMLLRKHIVLLAYLGLNEQSAKLWQELTKAPKTRPERRLENVLADYIPNIERTQAAPDENSLSASLENGDERYLAKKLGWFGKLAVFADSERKGGEAQHAAFISENISYFARVVKVILAAAPIGLVSLLVLIVAALSFAFRWTKRKFAQTRIPSDLCLEIFCLYLCIMFFSQQLAALVEVGGSGMNPMLFTAVFLAALPLLVFWPVFFGQKTAEVRDSLGLSIRSFRSAVTEIVLGPLSYLASIIPLLGVLILYSFLLVYLGIDASRGAHPIVPLLASSQDRVTILCTILLAVVIAPIVEEIMFRGAFYSWLRSRLGAFVSILTSALIFAAVHPQGVIGIVPLTFIGALLAFLREWRNSLLAPMLAHACFNGGTLLLLFSLLR